MFRRRILGRKGNSGYEDVHNSCVVRFLDDTEPLTITFQKDTTGQYLIDHVCSTLDLAERDYFGLRYVDAEKQRHWIDPTRSAYRQLKNVQPMTLCFRVKFYPSEPRKLKEEITRYYLFLQLSRDFYHGRLLCSQSEAIQLSALLIQAELGDYSGCVVVGGGGGDDDDNGRYVTQLKNLPKQIEKQEKKVADAHKELNGMAAGEAEERFIEMASHLDTYGVDPHPVKDASGTATYLGVTHLGVVTFQGNKRTHLFHWPQITKLDYDGKHFIVQASATEDKENTEPVNAKKKKQSYNFKCPSSVACKHLWKCAVQQQYFFTLQSSTSAPKVKAGGGLFRRPSKYRFSGNCESEVLMESAGITRNPPSFKRSTSNPQFLQMFDKLGSSSLPSSFRSKDVKGNSCDVMLEPPRSESLDHGMAVILERSEEKMAVEPAAPVQIFDANYEPMLSPDKEEPPAFPGITEEEPTPEDDSGVDLNSDTSLSSASRIPLTEVDYSELASANLDAQIKELQMELEKCKNPPVTHPPPAKVEEPSLPIDLESSANHTTVVETSQVAPNGISTVHSANEHTIIDEEHSKGSPAFPVSWSNVAIVLFVGLFLALIFLLVLFETELNFPLLSGVRRWPEVDSLRRRVYRPVKAAIGRLFKW